MVKIKIYLTLKHKGKNMHIVETHAVISGAKINKCFIDVEPYHIPYSKYITFHPECPKASARQYKFWSKVLELLKQNINFKYPIIQLGSLLDKKYDVDLILNGNTNMNQLAYIMQNSSFHFGYDSFPMHLASHFDIKMVVLFAYYSNGSRPYFSTPSNVVVLEPDFSIKKPSMQYIDPNDLINTIPPELVYENIIRLLEIK